MDAVLDTPEVAEPITQIGHYSRITPSSPPGIYIPLCREYWIEIIDSKHYVQHREAGEEEILRDRKGINNWVFAYYVGMCPQPQKEHPMFCSQVRKPKNVWIGKG